MANKIWFTGCLHVDHENIVRGTTKWKGKEVCRDFDTMEAHNQSIVSGINKYVDKQDVLYIVGDVKFGDKNTLINFLLKLNVVDVRLIYGNHDDYIRNNKPLTSFGKIYKPQDLFNYCVDKEELVYKNKLISIDHYPYESWRDSHKENKEGFMFHSHVHGTLHDARKNRRIDVGWDSSYLYFNEYRPFELNEAIQLSLNPINAQRNEAGRIADVA